MFSKCRLQCALPKYTKNNKPSSSLSEIALEISACRSESDMLRNAQVTVLVITLERSIIRQLAVLRVQFFHNSANLFIYNTMTTTFLPLSVHSRCLFRIKPFTLLIAESHSFIPSISFSHFWPYFVRPFEHFFPVDDLHCLGSYLSWIVLYLKNETKWLAG